MRKYQLTMKLSVFDGTRSEEDGRDLTVYVDGNDVWGVICEGVRLTIDALTRAGRHRPVAFGATNIKWG